MVKILIVSHGPLADAIKTSAGMFVDTEGVVETLGLLPDDSIENFQEKIRSKICELDDGDGVLILADMFAGSPCNRAAMVIGSESENHKLQCLTGVNLPLVTEAASSASYMSLEELVSDLEELAGQTILNLRKVLEI